MPIKEKKVYITSDGSEFGTRMEAEEYEEISNIVCSLNLDDRSTYYSYFKIVKRIKENHLIFPKDDIDKFKSSATFKMVLNKVQNFFEQRGGSASCCSHDYFHIINDLTSWIIDELKTLENQNLNWIQGLPDFGGVYYSCFRFNEGKEVAYGEVIIKADNKIFWLGNEIPPEDYIGYLKMAPCPFV